MRILKINTITRINTITSLALMLALVAMLAGSFLQVAHAAPLTNKSNTMSSLKVSTLSDHTIQFTTPTGVAAGQDITVTFPIGWDITSILFSDVDIKDGAVDLAVAATPVTATWGAVVSGQTLTLTNGNAVVTAGSAIEIQIGLNAGFGVAGANQITNHATPGTYLISIAGTFADTGDIAVNLLTDDQVAATATVVESLSFSISHNSIAFGTLTTANARWANTISGSATEVTAHNIIVGTNGTSGYILTVSGNTLTSGANIITAIGATAVASAPGTEQFGIKALATGGDGVVSAPYASANYAFTPPGPSQLASAIGASADTTYDITYIANIAALTEAGSYTSTLTYTATATF